MRGTFHKQGWFSTKGGGGFIKINQNNLCLDTVVFKAGSLWGRVFLIELEFGSVGICGGRKTREPEGNPRSKDENQQQSQPKYDARSGNRARATLVRGEHSHHCPIPAPLQWELSTRGTYCKVSFLL